MVKHARDVYDLFRPQSLNCAQGKIVILRAAEQVAKTAHFADRFRRRLARRARRADPLKRRPRGTAPSFDIVARERTQLLLKGVPDQDCKRGGRLKSADDGEARGFAGGS